MGHPVQEIFQMSAPSVYLPYSDKETYFFRFSDFDSQTTGSNIRDTMSETEWKSIIL